MKPAAITPSDVRRYVAELVDEERYATTTINNSLVVLRLFLGHLREDGVIASNPAATPRGPTSGSSCRPSTARWTTCGWRRSRCTSARAGRRTGRWPRC
jgi:site-specific recombinase XerD